MEGLIKNNAWILFTGDKLGCAKDQVELVDQCLYISVNKMDFEEARKWSENQGGMLLSVQSAAHYISIIAALDKFSAINTDIENWYIGMLHQNNIIILLHTKMYITFIFMYPA